MPQKATLVSHVYAVATADIETTAGAVYDLPVRRCPSLCPCCGADATARVVCARCDFVLDTTVLGDDILDDMAHLRLRSAGAPTRLDVERRLHEAATQLVALRDATRMPRSHETRVVRPQRRLASGL